MRIQAMNWLCLAALSQVGCDAGDAPSTREISAEDRGEGAERTTSLHRSGAPTSTTRLANPPVSQMLATLINDGSFENGPPPASAWTEEPSDICESIGDWRDEFETESYDGIYTFWGGGYCGFSTFTNSVSQSGIEIPLTDNELRFWYLSRRLPIEDDLVPDDYAYLEVNDVELWRLDLSSANNTTEWTEVVIPIDAYVGQSVTLKLGVVAVGDRTGNIFFDAVQIGSAEPPPPPPSRCPEGYSEVTVLATEGFEGSFPPVGWTATDRTTDCPEGLPGWSNSDVGARGNRTGGTGSFAIADSDLCSQSVVMDAELRTPVLDLTGMIDPVVEFKQDFYALLFGMSTAAVDVSLDGGLTWSEVLRWDSSVRGPSTVIGALPSADLCAALMVRWHYIAGWDWWWQLDDVTITACQLTL